MVLKEYAPVCRDTRRCFAKTRGWDRVHNKPIMECRILTENACYQNGKCPFCKAEREVTKGKFYPYNRGQYSYIARTKYEREKRKDKV